jgi:hypothetical protein
MNESTYSQIRDLVEEIELAESRKAQLAAQLAKLEALADKSRYLSSEKDIARYKEILQCIQGHRNDIQRLHTATAGYKAQIRQILLGLPGAIVRIQHNGTTTAVCKFGKDFGISITKEATPCVEHVPATETSSATASSSPAASA